MYQRRTHCTVFREVCYWALLGKFVEKLQIWLKADNSIHMKTSECFIVVGDTNSPLQHYCTTLSTVVLLTMACTSVTHTHTHTQKAMVHLHCNNGYTIAPQCYHIAYLLIVKTNTTKATKHYHAREKCHLCPM